VRGPLPGGGARGWPARGGGGTKKGKQQTGTRNSQSDSNDVSGGKGKKEKKDALFRALAREIIGKKKRKGGEDVPVNTSRIPQKGHTTTLRGKKAKGPTRWKKKRKRSARKARGSGRGRRGGPNF